MKFKLLLAAAGCACLTRSLSAATAHEVVPVRWEMFGQVAEPSDKYNRAISPLLNTARYNLFRAPSGAKAVYKGRQP